MAALFFAYAAQWCHPGDGSIHPKRIWALHSSTSSPMFLTSKKKGGAAAVCFTTEISNMYYTSTIYLLCSKCPRFYPHQGIWTWLIHVTLW
jgi:hypothetical protein